MMMNINELRPIRSAYVRQGGGNTQVGGLTLWQAYFLLYVAWREVSDSLPFGLPDRWLSENACYDSVTFDKISALRDYVKIVQNGKNVVACAVAGLTDKGKSFLQKNVTVLSDAIQAFGLAVPQINSL